MKKIARRSILTIALGLLILTYLIIGWPIIRKARLQKKYPLGASMEEVLKRLKFSYSLVANGPVFPDEGPTEQQKKLFAFFDLTIPKESVRLEFNYYSNLIGVLVINHPLTASWEKLTGQ